MKTRNPCGVGLFVLILFLLTPQPGRAETPSYHEYGDWLIACSNALTCEAKGFDAGQDGGPDLRIIRFAGNDDIQLEIDAPFFFGLSDLRLDGRVIALNAQDWTLSQDADFTRLFTTTTVGARAFIAQLRAGTALSVGRKSVPLDGMTATLLKMDERQTRIGTPSALKMPGTIRLGHQPAKPPLPAVPLTAIKDRLTDAEQHRQIDLIRSSQSGRIRKDGCTVEGGNSDDAAYALGKGQALVFISCFIGAYQGTSYVFIVPRGGSQPAAVFTPTLSYLGNTSPGPILQLTSPSFDPETGTLRMVENLRGPGDCGLSAAWRWDGATFQLTSVSFQNACGGSAQGDWPTLYETQTTSARK